MLKKSAGFILASFRHSTYPRGYASALHSLRPCTANFLSILGERLLLFQTSRNGLPWLVHMLVSDVSDRLRLPR
jgi:hypothetical protein